MDVFVEGMGGDQPGALCFLTLCQTVLEIYLLAPKHFARFKSRL